MASVPSGSASQVGDADLDHEATSGLEVGGGVREAATCCSWVVRFPMVLNTR